MFFFFSFRLLTRTVSVHCINRFPTILLLIWIYRCSFYQFSAQEKTEFLLPSAQFYYDHWIFWAEVITKRTNKYYPFNWHILSFNIIVVKCLCFLFANHNRNNNNNMRRKKISVSLGFWIKFRTKLIELYQ